MTKMTSIIKNYQDSCTQGAANRQVMPNYDCKKPNLILEARYCGELVGKICNFFYLHVPFSPLMNISRFMSI